MGNYNSYYIDGNLFVSVSTILNMESAGQLVPWALKKFGPEEHPMQAYEAFMNDVSAQGTLIHSFIEHDLKGLEFPEKDLTPALVPVVEQYYQWKKDNKVVMLESEVKCHSKRYCVAGTCDFVGTVNDQLYIVDFKTGSVQPKAFSQLAAYQSFLVEMGREEFRDAKLAVLNIHRDGEKCEFITHDNYYKGRVTADDELKLFHALRFVWYYRNAKSRKFDFVVKNMQDLISPMEEAFHSAFQLPTVTKTKRKAK